MGTLIQKVRNLLITFINFVIVKKRRGAAAIVKRNFREKPRKPRTKHAPIVPEFNMEAYDGLSSDPEIDQVNSHVGNDGEQGADI